MLLARIALNFISGVDSVAVRIDNRGSPALSWLRENHWLFLLSDSGIYNKSMMALLLACV